MATDKNAPADFSPLIRAVTGAMGLDPVKPTDRDMAMIGYSPELKALITRAIEVNPAMEETFLAIAELAFLEGETDAT